MSEWTTRGGVDLLTRDVNDPPTAWRWEYIRKVMYWKKEEVFQEPWADGAPRVFKRGNKLYAVHDSALY